ncbi:MAG: hypothetical protein IT281_01055 [Ignavibacteria bacterium]|nr:hypothetical protein [Ignavibacteria bacterium]MCC7158108.1 hypothetical protein [Ignavibacteria bacterium]
MRKIKKLSLKKVITTESRKDDVIKVTGFKVTPLAAKPGSTVTIRMTIRNVSEKLLKVVPWQIVNNKKILDCGIRCGLPSGDSFRITTTWTATKGAHFLYGDADPKNTLKEPKIKQFNNLPQGADVKVK